MGIIATLWAVWLGKDYIIFIVKCFTDDDDDNDNCKMLLKRISVFTMLQRL